MQGYWLLTISQAIQGQLESTENFRAELHAFVKQQAVLWAEAKQQRDASMQDLKAHIDDHRAAAKQTDEVLGREAYDEMMKVVAKDSNDHIRSTLENVKILVKALLKADQEIHRGPPWVRGTNQHVPSSALAAACMQAIAACRKYQTTKAHHSMCS